MKRQVLWLFCGTMALCSCATTLPPPIPTPPLPVVHEAVDVPSAPAAPIPAEDRAPLLASEPAWVEGLPLQVVTKAAKLATMKPALAGFDRAMLVYPYRPYAVYWTEVPTHGALHIQLQPGEVIRLVAGWRQSDWIVQRDEAATALEVSHLTVTPTPKDEDALVHGRMVLITSLGVYYLDLHSRVGAGLYGISWRHPAKGAR